MAPVPARAEAPDPGRPRGRIAALVGAIALLAVAAVVPAGPVSPWLAGMPPADARRGLTLLRLGLALDAILLLAWCGLPPSRFRGPGLPAGATGLRVDGAGRPAERAAWARPWLGAILALGAALRVVGMDRDLWLDEVATVVGYLRLPPWAVLYTYHSPNQHLLYSVVGSVAVRVLGEAPWVVRLPAVLFGIGGIGAFYMLARTLTSAREALLAAAFMAVSYHHVWFSQDARGYTAMLFGITAGTVLFLRGLTANRARDWAGYVASMGLAVLAVQTAVFVLAGHLLAYFVAARDARALRPAAAPLTRRVLAGAGLALLLAVEAQSLLLPQMLAFFRRSDHAGLGSGVASPLGLVPLLVEGLLTGFGAAALVAVVGVLGAGAWSYARQSPPLLVIAGVPPILGTGAILLLRYGAYPRAFLYVLPFAILFVVRGAAALGRALAQRLRRGPGWRLSPDATGVALAGALVLAAAAGLPANYRRPKQDYTGALAFVRARMAPGDRVAAVGMAAGVYRDYYRAAVDAPSTPAQLAALREPGRAVWVLYSFPRDMRLRFGPLDDYLRREAARVATFPGTVGDGALYVVRLD